MDYGYFGRLAEVNGRQAIVSSNILGSKKDDGYNTEQRFTITEDDFRRNI